MQNILDLRSDTVTRPSPAMRQAMHDAVVGDDVYGDDPTVNQLQSFAAEFMGHEAALFLPSGTQSNLVALLTHCARGDEYIVGADAHTFKYEGGGAAVLGGIQPQTVPFDEQGGLKLSDVAAVIKQKDDHFARTRLLCLENTQHGRVQSLERMQQAQAFAADHGLRIHLDGARMANACVAQNIELAEMACCFDSVSVCLSKGLGAPIGSVLLGTSEFIEQARRWRKVTGGGWRQAGGLAAAGLLALTDGVKRLHEDHENARYLSEQLMKIESLNVRSDWTQTNMVWVNFEPQFAQELRLQAKDAGVLLSVYDTRCRLVTHKDVDRQGMDRVVEIFQRAAMLCGATTAQ